MSSQSLTTTNEVVAPETQAPGALARAAEQAFTLVPRDLKEAMQFSEFIASSQLCPEAFRGKPADVLIAIQIGRELGVGPMQALSGICVINGKATIWGDLIVALVQASGELEYLKESWDEDAQVATCTIKRRGYPERVETFSMADAKRAKLDGKQTYQQYPQRLCGWRAKSWAIRADFSDVLKGLQIREEMEEVASMGGGVSIVQPRRISATVSDAEKDAFLGGGRAGAPRPVSGRAPSSSGPDGETWRGVIRSVSEKSGKSAKGTTWTLYTLHGDDGAQFGTFDSKLRDRAENLLGQPVAIVSKATERGNRNVVSLEACEPDEPGSEG